MDVSVILERTKENGYRASAFVPAPMVAEAATRDEAVNRIRAMLRERLAGAEVIQVAVPATPKPTRGSPSRGHGAIGPTWTK